MTNVHQHNAFIDALAAMPPADAINVIAFALTELDDDPLPWREALRLATLAYANLDKMRVRDSEDMAAVTAAADDYFARRRKSA